MENKIMRNFERLMTAAGLTIKEYGCVDGGIPKPGSLCYAEYNKTGKREDGADITVEYTDKSITSIEIVPGFKIDPKVHIVIYDWSSEEDGGSNVLGVYYDVQTAKKNLKNFVDTERDNLASYDPESEDYIEELTDSRWDYYKRGCSDSDYTSIYIASMPISMM